VTEALGQVPKVTGEMSEKDVEFLPPNPADDGIQGKADEEVDEQACVHLKQAVLRQWEMPREQEVDQVAQEDG
jgi:hypothetical protein